MSGPQYSIGELVGVSYIDPPNPSLVIPCTAVTAVEYEKGDKWRVANDGSLIFATPSWVYEVEGCDYMIPEKWLRPIQPGEYEDQGQHVHIKQTETGWVRQPREA